MHSKTCMVAGSTAVTIVAMYYLVSLVKVYPPIPFTEIGASGGQSHSFSHLLAFFLLPHLCNAATVAADIRCRNILP